MQNPREFITSSRTAWTRIFRAPHISLHDIRREVRFSLGLTANPRICEFASILRGRRVVCLSARMGFVHCYCLSSIPAVNDFLIQENPVMT